MYILYQNSLKELRPFFLQINRLSKKIYIKKGYIIYSGEKISKKIDECVLQIFKKFLIQMSHLYYNFKDYDDNQIIVLKLKEKELREIHKSIKLLNVVSLGKNEEVVSIVFALCDILTLLDFYLFAGSLQSKL